MPETKIDLMPVSRQGIQHVAVMLATHERAIAGLTSLLARPSRPNEHLDVDAQGGLIALLGILRGNAEQTLVLLQTASTIGTVTPKDPGKDGDE